MIGRGAPRRILRPTSERELDRMIEEHPEAALFAGGTLAVPDWRHGKPPEVALHLGGVAGLRYLGSDGCGALTTLADLAADDRVPRAVRQAAASIGGPAVRAMATAGGNVVAVRPGCVAVALLAAGATGLGSSPGHRSVNGNFSLNDLFMTQRILLRSIRWLSDRDSAFAKVAIRAASGPNVVSVAIGRGDDGAVIAVGAPGVLPHRLTAAEILWDEGAEAREVAAVVEQEVSPTDDITATTRYRKAAAAVLVRRLITDIEGGQWSRRRSTAPRSSCLTTDEAWRTGSART
ncbi:FAD binding domain-containing protein [Lentzea sp. NPDC055074]